MINIVFYRSEDSVLGKAYSRTKELWKKTFEENYEKVGAMYRGEEPLGFSAIKLFSPSLTQGQ
jgi:hypothetical protein